MLVDIRTRVADGVLFGRLRYLECSNPSSGLGLSWKRALPVFITALEDGASLPIIKEALFIILARGKKERERC